MRDSWDDFDDYVHSNIVGTKALLDACVGQRARVVYASSSSVYGNADRLPVDETTPLRPISPYGSTKVMTEAMAGAYAASSDVAVVGLRYFTVYGPRQRPDMGVSRFIEAATAGREISVYGDGRQLRDFTYVGDIVRRHDRRRRARHGRRRLQRRLRPAAAAARRARHARRRHGPRPRAALRRDQRGDVRDTHASIERAAAELGYAPETELREGLAEQFAEAERRRQATAAA